MNFAYTPGLRQISHGKTTVYEHERALKFENGRLVGALGAGSYRIWSWQKIEIWVFDARRTLLSVGGQKLLTLDGVTVTLSLVAEYEISDAALLVARVSNFQTLLYEEIQLAAREVVAARPLDELLAQRVEINALLTQICAEKAREYGVTISQVAIKDTVLSNRVRELLMKEVEAKRLAQAALLSAREEVATLRALSNAARLARENPELLRLRELEVARQMSQNGGTMVFGTSPIIPSPQKMKEKSAPDEAAPES
ncbi:SPFH domain / Band 7 family protein [Abditibacterium utsteinense]|uniref:SPFH domain / Band 7 family protein n=1 Tax=Abditibacterium utsteinense TaxID=1960156 RepID=A0A2S8SP26_9BACT|nr:slipin family protein [Abditibacterium utsteinense]PQV62547.1 SPFH domain / Band 7 family protein [Abditibacterium utsteinense]